MDIPPEIEIKFCIKKGSILFFNEKKFFESKKPHNFIILNKNPLKEKTLFLICATSLDREAIKMVENKNLPNETWVSIGQNESTYFNRETLFNCNTVQAIGFREVSDKLKEKKLKIKGIIEKDILERIYKGILASPMIEEQILKKLEIK